MVWEADLAKIQQALPLEITCTKLKDAELPSIAQELSKLDAPLKDASAEAVSLSERLEGAKSSLKSLQSLKQQASAIHSVIQRKDAALQQVKTLESSLFRGSSIKSLEEIQTELGSLQKKQSVSAR